MIQAIRSKDRVRDLGEVFTAPREVNAMLDLVTNTDLDIETATFLEPSCGNGQFLAEIFGRKCEAIMRSPSSDGWDTCTRILRALATITAIDIDETNVKESHERLLRLAISWREIITGTPASRPFTITALEILKRKVVLGDFLVGCTVHDVRVTDRWAIAFTKHTIGGGHTRDERGRYFPVKNKS